MKNYYSLLIACFFYLNAYAQVQTGEGHTFWLSFMQNYGGSNACSDNSLPVLKIIITSPTAASGTVSNPNTNTSFNFSIGNGGGVDTVLIPASVAYLSNSESSTDLNKGLLIQSNQPVSVTAQNIKTYSGDATMVLPVEALDVEYYILSHPGDAYGNNACFRSCFALVATEDSTTIDITPSCTTAAGKTANTMFSIVLNRGQTYFVKAASNSLDLSGTQVKARNCKRIAVFGGATKSAITYGACQPSYDHLFEQVTPLKLWANKYLCTPSLYSKGKNRKAELIKVVAGYSSTAVRVNGRIKILSKAGSVDTFFVTGDAVVISSKPIEVCQISISEDCDQVFGGSMSDPGMTALNHTLNFAKDIWFSNEFIGNNSHYFLNIVTKTAYKDSLQLDAAAITQGWRPFKTDSTYSYVQLDSLSLGKHHLSSPYGFAATQYTHNDISSYSLNVGFSTKTLTMEAVINNITIDASNTSVVLNTCSGTASSFNVNPLNLSYTNYQWLINDGTSIVAKSGKQFSYKFPKSGLYSITLIGIKNNYGLCNGQSTSSDSLKFKINVYNKPGISFENSKAQVCVDSMICVKALSLNAAKVRNFYWTFNGADTVFNDSIIRQLSDISLFVFTYKDSNQCINKDTIKVNALSNPRFYLMQNYAACLNDSIHIVPVITSAWMPKTYRWYIDGILSQAQDSVFNYPCRKDTRIRLVMSHQDVCHTEDSTTLSVLPVPQFAITGQTCYTDLDTVKLSTDKTFSSYDWFNGVSSRDNQFPASDLGGVGNYWVWCRVRDSNTCLGKDSLELTISHDNALQTVQKAGIKIYPNPVSSKVQIELPTSDLVEFYNSEGKFIQSIPLKEGISLIDVSEFSSGIYLLKSADRVVILMKE